MKEVRQFSSVMLHHDAITGTHGKVVNDDYKRIIALNNERMSKVKAGLVTEILKKAGNTKKTEVSVFNPSIYARSEIISVEVETPYYIVSND